MKSYLYLAQIIVAVSLCALVLLQAKDAGMSNVFGGSDMGVQKTRRGAEQTMFTATIGLGVLFAVLAIVTVVIAR